MNVHDSCYSSFALVQEMLETPDLIAGWNLLVQIGVACGVDLDKPKRARKIGNEYQEIQ
ncbi:hypothetical protein FACS189443_0300 [Planctomycetales bacterium]|nr:hypothetical protein FACS189443_0300 [Planctomycetales bacterium]